MTFTPPFAVVSDPTQGGGVEGGAGQFSHNLEFHDDLAAAPLSGAGTFLSEVLLWVFLRTPSLLEFLSSRLHKTPSSGFLCLCRGVLLVR